MNLHIARISSALVLAIASLAQAAPGEELVMTCVNKDASKGYRVFVGDEQEAVALIQSSASEAVVKLRQFAVVADGFQGDGKFRVLKPNQFKNVAVDNDGNYRFSAAGLKLICSKEQESHVNPALSGSN